MSYIIFIGDVVGRPGRRAMRELLPKLRERYAPVLVVANGENASGGVGITPDGADELFFYGVDVITSGNHIWKKRFIGEYLASNPRLLRPDNYPPETAGSGVYLHETPRGRIAVINLQGRVFMTPLDCPFRACDRILDGLPPDVLVRMVDFHAEATSEKQALGWYLAGRASLVAGTHTHVQTADDRILMDHTGYISDVGMTGALQSVIGMKRDIAVSRFLTGISEPFQVAQKNIRLQGVVADVDMSTGKCKSMERLQIAIAE